MKIACFSDLHIHLFKEFDEISDRTGSTRLDSIIESVEYIRDYCYENDIHYVLFGGDAFHTRGRVSTLAFNSLYDVMKTFHKKDIEVVMIAGNHDMDSNSESPHHSLHSFNDIPGISVYGELSIHEITDNEKHIKVFCTPYNKDAKGIKEWIEKSTSTQSEFSVLLGHLGVSGATVGSASYPMAEAFSISDLKPDYFDYIVMGHFHKRQYLGEYQHAFYCGSPIQHSFSDEGDENGFYVINMGEEDNAQFVEIPNPRFITVQAPLDPEILDHLSREGHYVRILADEEQLDEIQAVAPSDLKYRVDIQRVYEEQTRVGVKVGMSFHDIISKYAEEFNPDAKNIGLEILEGVSE